VRHLIVLLCGLALAATACGSSDSSSPATTTTEAQRTSSTAVVPGTAPAAAGPVSVPPVTRPRTVSSIDRSQLPPPVRDIRWGTTFSAEEQECTDYVIYTVTSENPDMAADTGAMAGVTGAAMVACAPQDKIAAMVSEDLKAQATPEQIECVQQQIVMADPQAVAVFLGGLAIDEPTIIASVAQAVDATCGTKLARG
jgi:hypothetical protein